MAAAVTRARIALLLIGLATGVTRAGTLSDPMQPPARATVSPSSVAAESATKPTAPVLRMVLRTGETRRALVGSQWVRVGDRLDHDGARVQRITDRSVVVQRGGTTEELPLPTVAAPGVGRSRP